MNEEWITFRSFHEPGKKTFSIGIIKRIARRDEGADRLAIQWHEPNSFGLGLTYKQRKHLVQSFIANDLFTAVAAQHKNLLPAD